MVRPIEVAPVGQEERVVKTHRDSSGKASGSPSEGYAPTPGKVTLTSQLQLMPDASGAAPAMGQLQLRSTGEAAAAGIQGSSGALPHHGAIQQLFGRHSIDGVRAHTGASAADACESMGANAYATGQDVAFKSSSPDLHTTAHEAAHVVQQRGGVQLSGGVGQAGDPHERHADAVADAVVAGRSAEGLLDQYAGGGGGGGVQRQAVQMDGDDKALEDTLEAVAFAYKDICEKQRDAVQDLKEDAAKEDPPPLWQSLLLAAAQVALAGALGGVGGAISAAVAKKLAGKVSEIAANAIATAMEDAAKDAAGKTVTAMAGQIASTSSDPREIFFRGQRDTLTDTAMKQRIEFITKHKQQIRAAKEPKMQADALLASLQENYEIAYVKQRDETLDQWCSYQAKQALGTNNGEKTKNPGTNLGSQLGDTSAKGVLGIVMRVHQPGSAVTIKRAEIEGLNEGLRKVIESRPIKALKMPITVKGEVGEDIGWAREYLNKESQPRIECGRNETGTVWMGGRDYRGLSWLHLRAHPHAELWGPGGPTREHTREAAFEGARMLIEQDMANLTVAGKLSG
jgi:Domain of unknown function (DUF4157)